MDLRSQPQLHNRGLRDPVSLGKGANESRAMPWFEIQALQVDEGELRALRSQNELISRSVRKEPDVSGSLPLIFFEAQRQLAVSLPPFRVLDMLLGGRRSRRGDDGRSLLHGRAAEFGIGNNVVCKEPSRQEN